MSILATSPNSTRHFDMNIANALGSMEAAAILQQLHYWMEKEGIGEVIEGRKFIYNTFRDWVDQQFRWLTTWKFRKAMRVLRSLSIVEVIRYKSRQWNQTNYYSLNYERLREWAEAESIEIAEMCNCSPQEEKNQTLEMMNPKLSILGTKNTSKKNTAKQNAAASTKSLLEEDESQKHSNPHEETSIILNSQKNGKLEVKQSNSVSEKDSGRVDYLVNFLKEAEIPVNRTLRELVESYSLEEVERAIALVNARKREKYVPNPSGYLVAVLKNGWANNVVLEQQETSGSFRHWYELARELGYCSGQEVRDGGQWVFLSGSWERWEAAVERGYSLEYLKKLLRRSQGN